MSETMRQPVIVENRPGASSVIGAQAVAASAPDGYTILLGDVTTYAFNPSLVKALPYDPKKSFAPISLANRISLVLVATRQ